ncbi:MAG: hypothetical protein NXI12_09210 [Alphaproteobacteria bacterium]|nr:hypothetical protein [Alphaproteobacteria bacterium]
MTSLFKLAAACLAAVGTTACVSQVETPVGSDIRSAYALVDTRTDLAEGRQVPDRYDRSVASLIDDPEGFSEDYVARMDAYAEGGLSEDNGGETLLAMLINEETSARLTRNFTGERPARLNVEVVSTTFPNTATMMLVGEVIGLQYEFELVDVETGEIVVESVEPIAPIVDRSAGAGGGLLGLALRGGGENRHLLDLENMANATAQELAAILGGGMIYESDVDKIEVHGPVSAASARQDDEDAEGGEPVSR